MPNTRRHVSMGINSGHRKDTERTLTATCHL